MMKLKEILKQAPLDPKNSAVGLNPASQKDMQEPNPPMEAFDSFDFQKGKNIKVSFHHVPVPVSAHVHDYYEYFFVYRGSFRERTYSQTLFLDTGDLLLLPPRNVHSIIQCSKDCIGINLIIKETYFQEELLPLLSAPVAAHQQEIMYYSTSDHPQLHTLADQILDEVFLPDRQCEQILTCYTALLINQAERIHQQTLLSKKEFSKKQKENLITKILQYIMLNYRDVTLTQLSAQYGYSENYVSQLIKEETGYSFSQYKLNIQLEQAARLLLQNEFSVSSIAELTGFTNYSFFYRKFKQKYSVTPAEYRRTKTAVNQ